MYFYFKILLFKACRGEDRDFGAKPRVSFNFICFLVYLIMFLLQRVKFLIIE